MRTGAASGETRRVPARARSLLAVVAGCAALAGCATSSATPPASRPRTSATTTTAAPLRAAAAGGSAGCGRAASPGPTGRRSPTGDVARSIVVDGVRRTYRLEVPDRYDDRRPTPLVVLFHGWSSDALEMSAYSGLPRAAAAAGVLVASPDARGGAWQLSSPLARTADLAFVAKLLISLEDRYCVDRRHVDAAGFSLGSEFAALVGCAFPRSIAAVGLVAAEFLPVPCPRRVPVVAFHGTADPAVAYPPGGIGASLPGIRVPGVVHNLDQWAALDGCASRPSVARLSSQVILRRWRRCHRGDDVELYTIVGGGHAWPGSPLPGGSVGMTTRQISATSTILRFFAAQALNGGR